MNKCLPNKNNHARFWAFVNCDWVKLTLTEDRPELTHLSGGPTDEGYSFESETWSLEDGIVTREWYCDARDCDGRHQQGFTVDCPVERLKMGEVHGETFSQFSTPDWMEIGYTQRDHTAEAAGY